MTSPMVMFWTPVTLARVLLTAAIRACRCSSVSGAVKSAPPKLNVATVVDV